MNAACRHLSVRLWLTAIAGGMACIAFLPWWQQALGVEWLIFPAFIILGACFAAAGWMMNSIGLGFLGRQVNEAAAWERAGMMPEAETAFGKAMATFDSFWMSPLLRRGKLRWFSGQTARFYLGQNAKSVFARTLIATHLADFPQDAAVAEPWLEQLLAFERHLPLEHEAVALVGDHLAEHWQIQRLLMQFYMANGRVDFDALQTYRRVWKEQQPLPYNAVQGLSRLLRNEYLLNHWTLQVYLKAYEGGDKSSLEGIAAAARWLPATEASRPFLKAAHKILEVTDPQTLGALNPRFKPSHIQPAAAPRPRHIRRADAQQMLSRWMGMLQARGSASGARVSKLVSLLSIRQIWSAAGIALALALVVVAGWRYFSRPVAPPAAQPPVVREVVITDPFTIQVAAYLKSEDAQRLVDQLHQDALDAFWTQAKSANRTWYQVKVAHFATRQEAQHYGQELKSKGLIDDFYVANYEHERRNDQKK